MKISYEIWLHATGYRAIEKYKESITNVKNTCCICVGALVTDVCSLF